MLTLLLLLGCGTPTLPPDADVDGDAFDAGDDCDDRDPTVWPGAYDAFGDGIDRNCDGADGVDLDADGHGDAALGGDDCDDADPTVHPSAVDVPYDGIDNDCADGDEVDVDDDGDAGAEVGGTDCDDSDADVNRLAEETCDGRDEDCDGEIDEHASDAAAWYVDEDGDGYGVERGEPACTAPPGHAANGGDCNDADPDVAPGLEDVCGDGIDADCDPDEPTCGIWEDMDQDDAVALLRGSVDVAYTGGFLSGGQDLVGDGGVDLVLGVTWTTAGETTVALWAGPTIASAEVDDADVRIVQSDGSRRTMAFAVSPDLTGDGAADLFVVNGTDDRDGHGVLLAGPFSGDRALDEADVEIALTGEVSSLLSDVAAPGDLTGDGNPDLALTGKTFDEGVYILEGPLAGTMVPDDAVARIEPADSVYTLGGGLSGGDADGDGIADLFFRETRGDRALLYFGPFAGVRSEEDADAYYHGSTGFGCQTTIVGDRDLDGYAELVVGACTGGEGSRYYAFDAPAAGDWTVAEADLTVVPGDTVFHGASAAPDLDGDGRTDLVIGAWPSSDPGSAYVFYGPAGGTRTTVGADVELRGTEDDEYFACAIGTPGDLDGDGSDELLVGGFCTRGPQTEPGYAVLWYGGSGS